MKRVFLITLLVFSVSLVYSQETVKKSFAAKRIQEPIKIDAVLDEAVWQRSEVATDFTQSYQNPGKPASQ